MNEQSPVKPSQKSQEPKTFAGWVVLLAVTTPVYASGIVGGAVTAMQGKSFGEGYDKTIGAICDGGLRSAWEFADKHNDTLVRGLIGGAASVLGGVAMGGVLKKK